MATAEDNGEMRNRKLIVIYSDRGNDLDKITCIKNILFLNPRFALREIEMNSLYRHILQRISEYIQAKQADYFTVGNVDDALSLMHLFYINGPRRRNIYLGTRAIADLSPITPGKLEVEAIVTLTTKDVTCKMTHKLSTLIPGEDASENIRIEISRESRYFDRMESLECYLLEDKSYLSTEITILMNVALTVTSLSPVIPSSPINSPPTSGSFPPGNSALMLVLRKWHLVVMKLDFKCQEVKAYFVKLIKKLLEKGANVGQTNSGGENILHMTYAVSDQEIWDAIPMNNVDILVTQLCSEGCTPLLGTARKGWIFEACTPYRRHLFSTYVNNLLRFGSSLVSVNSELAEYFQTYLSCMQSAEKSIFVFNIFFLFLRAGLRYPYHIKLDCLPDSIPAEYFVAFFNIYSKKSAKVLFPEFQCRSLLHIAAQNVRQCLRGNAVWGAEQLQGLIPNALQATIVADQFMYYVPMRYVQRIYEKEKVPEVHEPAN